jgi:hypothetical protein
LVARLTILILVSIIVAMLMGMAYLLTVGSRSVY